jgi:hypothetical protein
MKSTFFCLIFTLFVLNACNNQSEPAEELFHQKGTETENREIREVIYSMYLPTDMANLFKQSGANYDPDIPAPINDITLYTNQEQIAVMLGIYGVDISYMKILEQNLPVAQYYRAIESLSKKIGIPNDIFEKSYIQLEKYFNNADSLSAVLENIYRHADNFFRENDNENLSALVLAGGWVEAVYIGLKIYEENNGSQEMAERLLQQKFSLNSVYTILSNHQESQVVKEYLLMLKKIRKVFDRVEIRYQKEGFSVDTAQKKIQNYNAHISYDEKTMDDLSRIIPLIRNELISIRAQQQ